MPRPNRRLACRLTVALTLGWAALGSALAADPVASVRLLQAETTVEADGSAVQVMRIEIAAANDGAARSAAQQTMTYTQGLETVELLEGHTVKPDGRRLPVPPGSVRRQLAPGIPGLPQYANRMQVVAVMPDVAGGDVLSLSWRRHIQRPVFPGRFAATSLFPRTVPWDDATIVIRVPTGMVLNTESFGPAHVVQAEGNWQVHRWTWQAPGQAADTAALAPLDRVPRLFASTFRDWTEFSRDYAALVATKVVVTPRIQALADRVTAGSADRQEEARRLHDWVALHIRWVALYVGDGSFVPHPAEEVLANGHGDCKDQVTLLIALLRARGIAAEPVLVNLGPTYRLSGPATLSAFNHAITYLPEWDLYGDTTGFGAPLGTLQAGLHGKPILHVRAEGAAPQRMPVLRPGATRASLQTSMRLDAEGRITGETTTEATGGFLPMLRRMATETMAAGTERAATERLRVLNWTGTGAFAPDPLDRVGPAYAVGGQFALAPMPGVLEGDALLMPTGLRLLPRPGDGLLGPLGLRGLPPEEPTPCHSGEQVEALSLALPPGYRLARLPRARAVQAEAFRYESRWTAEAGEVRVVRRIVTQIDHPLCEGPLRAQAAKLLEEIRRDLDTRIELERDG